MSSLKQTYQTTIVPALRDQLGRKHALQVPRITKVTINSGLNSKRDPKFMEVILDTISRISGQQAVQTKARLSEAGFKIREGQTIGAMVTLRGNRMWDFIDKLVNVTFPRIRDFQGITESCVDQSGNFNFGFKEHVAFPEINANEVDQLHGLQVNITTTAKNREEGLMLFKALGFPFKTNTK